MGWSTEVSADVSFHKETYNSIYQVEEKIKDLEKDIANVKAKLLVLAASDPANLKEVDCEGVPMSIEETLPNKLDELFEWYEEALIKVVKLEYLKDNWHFRYGDFVEPDKYCKYVGETNLIFKKDTIYEVNFFKEYDGTEHCAVLVKYRHVTVNKEDFDKVFTVSSKEEFNKQNHFY